MSAATDLSDSIGAEVTEAGPAAATAQDDGGKVDDGPVKRPNKRRRADAETINYTVVTRVYRGLRWVEPYHHAFETHTKGRWVGREILDVFAVEFRSETREAYGAAIEQGRLTVNGKRVTPSTILQHNDLISNTAHRHEPPVIATAVEIVYEDANVVAVDKPSSIPVHACGRYRYNTVQSILERESGKRGLLPCHRLDRLTSGVLIFAKNADTARRVQVQIKEHQLQKVYVCRVRGSFPEEPTVCTAPIKVFSHNLGVCSVAPDGKQCETVFKLQRRFSDGTSLVRCEPKTGRMHQIRVHLQHLGFPIANDPVYNLIKKEDGTMGKPEEWTVDRAIAQATTTLAARDAAVIPVAAAANDTEGTDWRQTEYYDPQCSECQLWRPLPKPHNMLIYLHAIEYSGPDWTIQTTLPTWAEE